MSEQNPKRPRRELWLLLLVTIAPIVASYLAYYVWRPATFKNYGELIVLTSLSGVAAAQPDSAPPFDAEGLKGRWVLVMVDAGSCAAQCREKLLQMRQLRLMQGKDQDRVARAWLLDDDALPTPDVLKDYDGTVVVPAKASPLIGKLPADSALRDHLFLVDPLGNLMMRFPKDADPNRIKKDLTHLLKVSRIG
jgi:cytochrome oxidase Cu insertion factor (SCO1/SenC/PrrC family)